MTRSDDIDRFLTKADWRGADRKPLAGDASFRRYERVFLAGRQAVVMDAPPDKEDVRPFMRVAEQLLAHGMSAPTILASDLANGLLLLEDLGDDLFSTVLRKKPTDETTLYLAASQVLIALHRYAESTSYVEFVPYDETLLLRECGLFGEWFLPAVMQPSEAQKYAAEYNAVWRTLLPKIPALRPVMVLRDYHADNLLWLPDRKGIKKVGVLDFQDAVIGSPAYDMVSFLEDARRDVSTETVTHIIAHYLKETSIPPEEFMAAYGLLGAQRNCKIIGIFMRLAVRDGKQNYLSYLPRVWNHLMQDLRHPLLTPLKEWMNKVIKPEWQSAVMLENSSRVTA